MAYDLLEVVQRVTEKLNLEAVNSINDSEEALLIAREAENTYYDLLSRDNWPQNQKLIELQSVGSLATPNVLRLPVDVTKIDGVSYDITDVGETSKSFRDIEYLEPKEFLDYCHSRNTDNDNVVEISYNNIPVFIVNDEAPTYWTSFDDEYLVFDSYNSDVETTLQGNKSICLGYFIPTWTMDDSFVIDIPQKYWPLYLAEVASACSTYLNQSVSPIDVQRSSRGMANLRRDMHRLVKEDFKVRYGRNGNGVS